MRIIEYTPELRCAFEEMLVEYFIRELQSDVPEDIIRDKLLPHIQRYVEKGIVHVSIAVEESPIGFSIYQIDSEESDWCKRPGWGFIREFWISKACRSKGYGRILAEYTEHQLRALGAEQLYLTSDDAVGFWKKCGWRNSHELCSNGLEILTK